MGSRSPDSIHVLLIEDNPDDACLVKEFVCGAAHAEVYHFQSASRLDEAHYVLMTHPEIAVILLDMSLPDGEGLSCLSKCREWAGNRPIVVLTGNDDQQRALDALRRGAQDYLIKSDINANVLVRVLRYAIERKIMQDETLHAKLVAERATEEKSNFLANMSHEIRTPMTAILGYAELLHAALADIPELQSQAEIIKSCGNHLLHLINDILDLSKIEAGKLVLEPLETSPLKIVTGIGAAMRILAQEKNLSLNIIYDSPIPRTIQTDPTRFRQVVTNLVGNAVKFSDIGEIQVRVRTIADVVESMLEVTVTDQGPGIPSDQLDKIYEPFCQADNSITRRYGGTGLGLSISRQLARALGGDLKIESTLGEGTQCTLTIATGSLEGVELLMDPSAAQDDDPATADDPADQTLTGRVLLVEDIPVNQQLIKIILERMGLEVVVAAEGQAALDTVASTSVDLILMDMQMPVMDGLTATRRLRAGGCDTPIVALTASAMSGTEETILRAGCNAYLTKPIDHIALHRTLSQYLPTTDSDIQKSAKTYHPIAANKRPARISSHPRDAVLIDVESAIERMGIEREVYIDILAESLIYLENQQTLLDRAVQANDHEMLAGIAHAIASNAGNIGMSAVLDLARETEHIAERQKGTNPASKITQLKHALSAAIDYGKFLLDDPSRQDCTLAI